MKIVLVYIEKIRSKYIYIYIQTTASKYLFIFGCKCYCFADMSIEALKLHWKIMFKEKRKIPLQLLQPQRRCRWEAVHKYITHSIIIVVAINWKAASAFQFMTHSKATCKILQKFIEKAHINC